MRNSCLWIIQIGVEWQCWMFTLVHMHTINCSNIIKSVLGFICFIQSYHITQVSDKKWSIDLHCIWELKLGLFWTILPKAVAMDSQQNVRSLSQKTERICVQYERRFRWRARCPLRHQIGLSVSEARRSGAFPLTDMKWNAQPVRGGQKTDTTNSRAKEAGCIAALYTGKKFTVYVTIKGKLLTSDCHARWTKAWATFGQ